MTSSSQEVFRSGHRAGGCVDRGGCAAQANTQASDAEATQVKDGVDVSGWTEEEAIKRGWQYLPLALDWIALDRRWTQVFAFDANRLKITAVFDDDAWDYTASLKEEA